MYMRLVRTILPAFISLVLCEEVSAGYAESKAAFSNGDYRAAHSECIAAANVGSADCQNAIGVLHQQGLGMAKDPEEAFRWFSRAAAKNNGAAQFNLSLMYEEGEGTEKNQQLASKLLLKAATSGNLKAQTNLGTAYATGRGSEKSQDKAVYWWQKAAEQGDPMAQNNIGWCLLNGKGMMRNPALARHWLEKAAQQSRDLLAQDLAKQNLKAFSDFPASSGVANFALNVDLSKPDSDGKISVNIRSQSKQGLRVLRIGGRAIELNGASVYSVSRYVPVGESIIDVYAESFSGERYSRELLVSRVGTDTQIAWPELDPSRIVPLPKRNAVAVVIGVENYESLPQADFSDNDARSFYDYANKALGVAPSRIKLLTGNGTRRNDILLVLRNWLAAEVSAGNTDVYIFYSGHGLASADGKKRYLLPADAKVDLLEDTALSLEQILGIVDIHQPKSLTLLFDSCYSGSSRGGNSLLASVRPVGIFSEVERLPANVTLLSSSSGSQVAAASPEMRHGFFSYFLMKGLEGDADQNKDSIITAQELHTYVSSRVSKEALRRGIQQTPALSGYFDKILVSQNK